MAIGARKSENFIYMLYMMGVGSARFVADHYDYTIYARRINKRLKKARNRAKRAAKTETI
jgi:hypothetical protein